MELINVLNNRLNLLQETRDFYYSKKFNPLPTRASDNMETCFYCHPDTGNKCAIGRLLRKSDFKRIANQSLLEYIPKDIIENLLKRFKISTDNYGKDMYWLQKLQIFHDNPNRAKDLYQDMSYDLRQEIKELSEKQ